MGIRTPPLAKYFSHRNQNSNKMTLGRVFRILNPPPQATHDITEELKEDLNEDSPQNRDINSCRKIKLYIRNLQLEPIIDEDFDCNNSKKGKKVHN